MIRWDETDFIEFFGSLPEEDEDFDVYRGLT